ncbi:methyltransferase domain-containing protein [Pseudarthrobacter sulfonivorans]|uniref:methyltransferase domain-containing protein n=1 Tax=Pseudarthrobacter sulfonivorans TaxID=121292 RepID=UPI0021027AC9|nr:methyltransferase domain-containing protein [Pseudarthrobacter sulfonivorans]
MPSSPPPPLRCPLCGGQLALRSLAGEGARPALRCGAGHSFDAARQGYYNLLVGKGTVFEADSADMVAARFDFLEAGHYRPLADAVSDAVLARVQAGKPFTVLDSGTGTGHYLRVVLDDVKRVTDACTAVALDISKFALRRAARRNPEAISLACDVWQELPVADDAVDVVTVIFAPRNAAEFARVLNHDGRLVVVTPRAGHLASLASLTGMLSIEDQKDARLAESLAPYFLPEATRDVDIRLALTRDEMADLAFMGPAGHHLDRGALAAKLDTLEPLDEVEALFRITVFRPAGRPA